MYRLIGTFRRSGCVQSLHKILNELRLFFEIPCQQESLDAHKFLLTLTRQCQNVWTLSSHLWKYNHQSRGRVIIDYEYLAAHLSRSKANLRACVIIVSCVWHACNLVPKQFEQKTHKHRRTRSRRGFSAVFCKSGAASTVKYILCDLSNERG